MTTVSQMQTAIDKSLVNMDRLDDIVNGDATTVVTTDGGPVKSIAKLEADLIAEVEAGLGGASIDSIVGLREALDFTQSGTGAQKRTIQSRLAETISVADYGAIGDGVAHTVAEWIIPGALGRFASFSALQAAYPHVTSSSNSLNWAAFQAATNYAMTQTDGCTVTVPRGRFHIIGSVVQDRTTITGRGVVNYVGSGRRSTTIIHYGPTTLFSATGPAAGVQQNTDLTTSGMTLLGSSMTGEIAIGQSYCSDSHFADLHIEGFEYAFYMQDCDQAVFDACMVQFNKRGLFARQNPTPTGNSTQPNQYVFNGCTWMNNSQNGLHCIGGSNWTFNGGVISTNGAADNVNGFGIKFEESGYQGGNACVFSGTNFESNNGVGDVVLVQLVGTSPVITQNTYLFLGCSFNRTSSVLKSTSCIVANFASAATVGDQIITTVGCTFKSYNDYVPSSSTPYINWVGAQGRTARNFSAYDTVFKDPAESLSFVQRLTKPFAELSRTSNQSIPTGTPTIWEINSIGVGFSWVSTINGSYQIAIPEAGVYTFCASLSFTSPINGNSKIEILRGSLGVAANIVNGADVLSVSGTKYFSQGDLISVRVSHNHGSAVTLAGSDIAISYLNIQKVMDA